MTHYLRHTFVIRAAKLIYLVSLKKTLTFLVSIFQLSLRSIIQKATFLFMQRFILLALSVLTLSLPASATTGTEPTSNKGTQQQQGARPDLPGKLLINIGSSYFVNAPAGMETKIFESRPLDLYYTNHFDIPNLKLSFVPGIGFGFDRYSFKKSVVLDYQTVDGEETLVLDSIDNVTALRSKLITNYIDVPLELRFVPNIDAKERSLFIGLGGSIGYLFEAHTKFKYRDEDESKKMTKQREDWNLNKIRYSVHARVGFGGFSVYYKMGLSNVFETGKGPNGFDVTANTIGISFNGF